MLVEVLVDTTLTVKACQIVDVADNEIDNLKKLGRVKELDKKETKKKGKK